MKEVLGGRVMLPILLSPSNFHSGRQMEHIPNVEVVADELEAHAVVQREDNRDLVPKIPIQPSDQRHLLELGD